MIATAAEPCHYCGVPTFNRGSDGKPYCLTFHCPHSRALRAAEQLQVGMKKPRERKNKKRWNNRL